MPTLLNFAVYLVFRKTIKYFMELENLEKYQDISKLLNEAKTGDKKGKVSILFTIRSCYICVVTIQFLLMDLSL